MNEGGLSFGSIDSTANVRTPHKNRLSRLGSMFFHCRADLKAGDHDRKAERLLYRSLSAFDMDGCSEALNRGRYQMACSQWSNACRIFLRRVSNAASTPMFVAYRLASRSYILLTTALISTAIKAIPRLFICLQSSFWKSLICILLSITGP